MGCMSVPPKSSYSSVNYTAFTIPPAGVAASIGATSSSRGNVYDKAFGDNSDAFMQLFGGRASGSRGGGGGARNRTFQVPELKGSVTVSGEPAVFEHLCYTMLAYGPKSIVETELPQGQVACRMHHTRVLDKCDSKELKDLCRLHRLRPPWQATRDDLLRCLNDHRCLKNACEDCYVILSPVTAPPPHVISVDSEKFVTGVRRFTLEEMRGIISDDIIAQALSGFKVTGVYRDDGNTINDEDIPLVQIPLSLLIGHLTIAGLESLAFHHGVTLPGRGQAKKAGLMTLFSEHKCSACLPLFFRVEPIKRRATKLNAPGQSSRPAWIDEVDNPNRAPFLWEPFVNTDTEPWPPRPTSVRDVASAMQGYCSQLTPEAVEEEGCQVCGQLTKRVELIRNGTDRYTLDPLKEDDVSADPRAVDSDPFVYVADRAVVIPSLSGVCPACDDALKKGMRPKMALANALWLGEVPEVLKDLTLAERALITRVRYNRCVVRVSSGHAKMIANVISFEHPSMKIYDRLPIAKDELDDILAVVFTGVVQPNEDQLKRTPVLVRRNRVKRALEWLKMNHKNYADLEIDNRALESYPLEDVPLGVWHKPVGENEGNILASARSVFDNDDELGTSEGPCPFTVHGLTTEKFSTMSSTERKLAAVQHLKNGGAFLAVGHAPDPQTIWDNPALYPQMFPWLFPYGYGGVGQQRHKGMISKEAHLKWLLLYHDKRFQRDAGFLIVAFNHQLVKQNTKGSFMMCKRNNFAKVVTSIRSIQPGIFASIAQRMRAGTRVKPDTDDERRAFGLLDQVDVVGAQVNGSLASKKHQRNELWSLVYFTSTPNWFITLSPADNKHPLCIFWASEDLIFKPEIRTSADRLHLVTRNPVACARFFDYVVRLFIEYILGWTEDGPTHGIFGRPAAYYGSVEQQGRMTLHLHILIWITNALSPQAIRDKLMSADGEFQRRLIAYIEGCQIGEFMTGTKEEVAARVPYVPDRKLRGIHTILEDKSSAVVPDSYVNPTLTLPEAPPADLCNDGEGCNCDKCQDLEAWYERFKFSVDDIMLRSNVHKCFGRKDGPDDGSGSSSVPQRHATGKGCINKDGVCTARFPREVFLKTFVKLHTGQIFMKKLDSSINTVTPVITRCSLCNTDTTSLMSGTAVKAIIGYVTDYVTKGWLKTHQIFSSMYDVFERDAHLRDEDLKPTQAARKMVLRVVNSLTAKMEIGAPMAALYLLQNPDHYTSHDYVIFYWKNYVNKVVSDWKEALDLAGDCEDKGGNELQPEFDDVGLTRVEGDKALVPSEIEIDQEDTLVIHRAGGHFVGKGNTDDYIYRPVELQDVPLYEWIQCAIRVHTRSTRKPPKDLFFFRYLNEHPMSNTHVVACDPDRRRYIVPNFLGPALPRKDVGSREDYCCAMLTLFKPWCTGLDLKSSDSTWENAFDTFNFSKRQRELMDNFNLKYECYDERDDFGANFKAVAHALVDEDGIEIPNDEDEDDGVWNDGGEVGMALDDDTEEMVGIDTPGRDCVGDRAMYAEALAAIKRAGWSAWDQAQKITLTLPRLVVDRSLGVTAWRQLIKQQKEMFKDKRRKALDDMLTFDDEGGEGKVKNDAYVVPGAYLSKKFIPSDEKWGEVMDEIVKAENLNAEQEKAFRIVANHGTCVAPDQLLMHLGGMGGTGKSTVIKALIQFFRKRKEGYRFVLLGPTGTSAALIGGTTYHSFLGLRTGTNTMGGESLSAIEDLKQRVLGVSYVFIDEMSMLSCRDLCRISAKCCEAREMYEKPFGGLNVILAGDFAQLPPAKGTKLYDNTVSLQQSPGQTTGQQENTIGKIIWLQFTTVVILKQNMRQIGTSKSEKAFQKALANLRYFACSDDDVAVLRSRVAGVNTSLSLEDPRFRNVSIITARNRTKDQINASNAERFARETGQNIHEFVCVDTMTNSPPKRTSPETAKKKVYLDCKVITRQIQSALWAQRPHTSDQIPASLRLCLGMPVLIRNNEATELCMTRGQEARVVAWTASAVPHWENKKSLDVLYLQLTNPPHKVKLPHLPENVVPLTRNAQVLDARLPNDMYVHLSRSQIPVLPNFAMTDYSSQGKTRTYNVVDISECRSFQAIYTCLSRGKSLEGTLILRDFTAKEVNGVLHGSLRQEFRELNYLDTITDLRYTGVLPSSITQATRWETIDRYRNWKSTHEEEEWHPALQGVRPEDSARMPDIRSEVETLNSQKKRKLEAEISKPPPKSKKRRLNTRRPTYLSPAGPLWDSQDWSCAYDSLTFVLYALWKSDVQRWAPVLNGYGDIMKTLVQGFEGMDPFEDMVHQLTHVRNTWREAARQKRPGTYPVGRHGTELFQLCRDLLAFDLRCPGSVLTCDGCGHRAGRNILGMRPIGRFVSLQNEKSVQDMVTNRKVGLTECRRCQNITEEGYDASETIWVEVAWADDDVLFNSHIDVPEWGTYRLAGVIYHGSYHFVSRVVLDNGKVYVHDGAVDGYSTHEGTQAVTFPLTDFNRCGEKKASMVMYVKASSFRELESD